MLASTEDIFFSSDMPKEVVGGSTILRRHDDGKEIELKQPAPGYATIFRYVRKITGSSDDERGRVRVVQTQRNECTMPLFYLQRFGGLSSWIGSKLQANNLR